jgi:hypothetical protein
MFTGWKEVGGLTFPRTEPCWPTAEIAASTVVQFVVVLCLSAAVRRMLSPECCDTNENACQMQMTEHGTECVCGKGGYSVLDRFACL